MAFFPGLSWNALLEKAGLPVSGAKAAYERTGITVYMADRMAVGLGLHPAMVWPEWMVWALEAAEAAERKEAA